MPQLLNDRMLSVKPLKRLVYRIKRGNKLACNPRPHAITQRVLAQQKIVQQLWHGL